MTIGNGIVNGQAAPASTARPRREKREEEDDDRQWVDRSHASDSAAKGPLSYHSKATSDTSTQSRRLCGTYRFCMRGRRRGRAHRASASPGGQY